MTPGNGGEALLIDLDGVLRRWDPALGAAVEARYGLPPGAVIQTMMEWPRLVTATMGRVTDAEWMADVASAGRPARRRPGGSSVAGRRVARKPTREFYLAACAAVGVPPERCLVVDDDDRNIRGARVAGLPAYRWSGPGDLPYLRAALDLGRG